jgi:hypothetical protein
VSIEGKNNNGWRGPFPWPIFAERDELEKRLRQAESERDYNAMLVATTKESND